MDTSPEEGDEETPVDGGDQEQHGPQDGPDGDAGEDLGEDPAGAAEERPTAAPTLDGSTPDTTETPPVIRRPGLTRPAPSGQDTVSPTPTGSDTQSVQESVAPSPGRVSEQGSRSPAVQATVRVTVSPEADTAANPVGHFAFEDTAPVGAVGRVVGTASTTLLVLLGIGTLALRLLVGWPRFPTPYLGRRRCRTEDDPVRT